MLAQCLLPERRSALPCLWGLTRAEVLPPVRRDQFLPRGWEGLFLALCGAGAPGGGCLRGGRWGLAARAWPWSPAQRVAAASLPRAPEGSPWPARPPPRRSSLRYQTTGFRGGGVGVGWGDRTPRPGVHRPGGVTEQALCTNLPRFAPPCCSIRESPLPIPAPNLESQSANAPGGGPRQPDLKSRRDLLRSEARTAAGNVRGSPWNPLAEEVKCGEGAGSRGNGNFGPPELTAPHPACLRHPRIFCP